MKTRRLALVMVTAFGGAMLGADCQGNIVQDPTFRDWCGSSLCSWRTDFGTIERVPTWHKEDFGVSFLDSTGGTQISQVTQENQATCILFTSVGDIDPNANMTVSVDFNSDGSIDYTAPLGAATWHKVQSEIAAPPLYRGITVYVKKNGTGTAILAEMTVQSSTGCSSSSAPTLTNLHLGDPCGSKAQCASGLVCPPPGDGGLRLCGQCAAETPCAGGEACQRRNGALPLQCGPGRRIGQTGAPCIANSDCASSACDGATPVGPLSVDAGPCDLNAVSTNDATNCALYSALGGTCR